MADFKLNYTGALINNILGNALSTTDAANIYLTQANAATTYLTLTNAANIYLTLTNAANIYLTLTNAANTYTSLTNFNTLNSNAIKKVYSTDIGGSATVTISNDIMPNGFYLIIANQTAGWDGNCYLLNRRGYGFNYSTLLDGMCDLAFSDTSSGGTLGTFRIRNTTIAVMTLIIFKIL